jgi:hypothetical protein
MDCVRQWNITVQLERNQLFERKKRRNQFGLAVAAAAVGIHTIHIRTYTGAP